MPIRRVVEVEAVHRLCSRCGERGHNRNQMSLCIEAVSRPYYVIPTLNYNCSRCNQPGHKRNNQNCPLLQRYPTYRYGTLIEVNNDLPVPPVPQHIMSDEPIPLATRETNRMLLSNVMKVMSHFTGIAVRCEKVISRGDERDYTSPVETIHPAFIRLIESFNNVSSQLHRQQILNLPTNEEYVGLCNQMRTLMNINRDLNVFVFMKFTRECAEWIMTKPKPKNDLNVFISPEQTQDTPKVNECSICFDEKDYSSICVTKCNHKLCIECMCEYMKSRRGMIELPCPMCRSNIKEIVCHGHIEYKVLCDTRDDDVLPVFVYE